MKLETLSKESLRSAQANNLFDFKIKGKSMFKKNKSNSLTLRNVNHAAQNKLWQWILKRENFDESRKYADEEKIIWGKIKLIAFWRIIFKAKINGSKLETCSRWTTYMKHEEHWRRMNYFNVKQKFCCIGKEKPFWKKSRNRKHAGKEE